MAYLKQCIPISREVGAKFAAARRTRDAAYASAALYAGMGLKGRAKQMRKQADNEFNNVRSQLLAYMEVNGCL